MSDHEFTTAQFPVPDMADVELVCVLKTLGDPIRLRIIQVLADGEAHPKSLTDWGFEVQKSTMAHHFKTLRESGLTRTIVDGRNHTIQLRRDELDAKFPGLIDSLVASAAAEDHPRG